MVVDTERGRLPRDSRRPAPAKSRMTSTGTAKGGQAHGTRAHLQPGHCLLCRQIGHLARDCPNRGMRDDSGINLKRAFGSFVGMAGDASSLVFTRPVRTTTRQHEVERGSDFTVSHVPVAICLSLLVILEVTDISLVILACAIKDLYTVVFNAGTQTEPEPAPPPSPTRQRTPRTVLITENGMQSSKICHSSPVCSTLSRSMRSSIIPTVQSMPITFGWRLC